ncbi:MAG: iron chelate uptake ABC transporter family permease subunit [Geminicoccaceae bacterium]
MSAYPLTPAEIAAAVMHRLAGDPAASATVDTVLFGVRLLRIGAYLLVVDTLARSLGTVETPLGILTALLGAPFFLWLLARGRTGWA